MTLIMDPAGAETRALNQAADWRGKEVLEVGCGDGRLTLRLASLGPKSILAIDPDAGLVRDAREWLPSRYRNRVRFQVGSIERLRRRAESFDIVVLSWSL
jgi:predicted RNA methylase